MRNFDINKVRVATPCPTSWASMKGDDKSRFCDLCELNVHNLSAMTEIEIADLIAKSDGRLCGRFFRRADGTVITRDCPVGVRGYRKRVARFAGAALAALLGVFSVSFGQKSEDDGDVRDASKIKIERTSMIGTSSLRGTLMDAFGAVIPNGQVRLYWKSALIATRLSDAEGNFAFENLYPRRYDLTVTQSLGFRKLVLTNLEVLPNESQRMDLELSVDSVEVVGELAVEFDPPKTTELMTVSTQDMINRKPAKKPFE